MAETDKAYIGIRPCGCIVEAITAPRRIGRRVIPSKTELRAALKRMLKQGLRVELTTVGEARQRPDFLVQCSHGSRVAPEDVDSEVERLLEAA